MKKSTILILFVLAAMILGVVASASASPYSDGVVAIEKIRFALDNGRKELANEGLAELRTAVYAGMRELAAKGEYRGDDLNACLDYANQAVSGAPDFNKLLDLAKFHLREALYRDYEAPVVTSAHS